MTRQRLASLIGWPLVAGATVLLLQQACTEETDTVTVESTSPDNPVAGLDEAVELAADLPTTTSSTRVTTTVRASRKAAPAHRRPVVSGAATNSNVASYELLDRLAQCESGMYAGAVSATGRYFGAFQMLPSTWRSLGEEGNPVNYSYEYQREVARRIPVSVWGRQFPACARKLGVA